MKVLSYRYGGKDRYGIATPDGIIDAWARLGDKYPTLRDVLDDGRLGAIAGLLGESGDHAPVDIEFALPVPNARRILCAGRNYRAYHEVAEQGSAPKYPSIFGRMTSSFAPHFEAIIKPKSGDQLDYEGELVAVIGKRGRHIAQADAMDYVAGYTIMEEGTVRDWGNKGTQNLPSKNFHHCGSLGPWIITADEIDDPMKLHITTRRNGEVVQDCGTDMMIFDIAFLISHISEFTWLEPGDMITTGSPGGSIIESEAPDWLKAGDELEVEISAIGILINRIEDE